MKPASEASINIDKNLKKFFENFNTPNFFPKSEREVVNG